MELVQNKASGKSFIVIDDSAGACLLLITPEGKIKSLERLLFGPQIAFDPGKPQRNLHLTKPQMERYAEYFDE